MADPVITLPQTGGLAGLGADAAGLNQILGLMFGNSSTQTQNVGGSTQVTQNVVDQAAIDKTIRDMLEGDKSTNGLAALLTQQGAGGMYGGSNANLMVNDLVSRIVGEVAKLTSAKVVTNSGQTNTTTNSTDGKAKEAAAAAAALAALKKALGGQSKTPPQNKAGGGIGNKGSTEGGLNSGGANLEGDLSKGDTDDSPGGPGFDMDSFVGAADEFADANAGNAAIGPADLNQPDNDELMGDLSSLGGGDDIGDTGDYTGDEGGPGEGEGGDYTGVGDGDPVDNGTGEDTGGDNSDTTPLPEDDEESGGDEEGCFFTTAIAGARGLPDNCPELQILRDYRDGWLKENHPEAINEYYEIAPVLVSKINSRADAKEFYNSLYYSYLLPTIGHVLASEPVVAFDLYKQMIAHIQREYP